MIGIEELCFSDYDEEASLPKREENNGLNAYEF